MSTESTNIFPVADAHCDYLYHAAYSDYNFSSPKSNQHVTLERLREGHYALQFFAIWPDRRLKVDLWEQTVDMFQKFLAEVTEYKDTLYHYSPEKYDPSRIGAVLTIEGLGEATKGELSYIGIYAKLGVRAATLTWNDENMFAHPAMPERFSPSKRGLKRPGKKAVSIMNRFNMAVDVSHLNDAGIDDVLSLSTQPPFASHSNARGAFPSPRSLRDEHITEIASRGGVIGVNYYNGQLTNNKSATLDDVVKQIEYIAALAGTKCIALGSDFDGMGETPTGLEHPGKVQAIAQALLKLGYDEDAVRGIMFENIKNYIDRFYE